MRLSLFTVSLLACSITLVAAWSKEDQEIFRLRDEVEASEGLGVNFYDFLEIKRNANQEDIGKAYKKKSKVLHPDKVKQKFIAEQSTKKNKKGSKPGVHVSKGPTPAQIKAATKEASDRFTRLGLVNSILKGAGRERYDHFLANGFPKWKGTGYYYARFRPGFFTVLVSLFITVGGGFHYLFLYMSWKRQQDFVRRYIKFARHSAWGDNLNIPGLDGALETSTPAAVDSDADAERIPRNRKERRMMEKEERKEKPENKSKAVKAAKVSPAATPPAAATGRKKRVQAENGKILIVDSVGNVYLEQRDDNGQMQEYLLDVNEIPAPTMRDTALFRLPTWVIGRVAGRFAKTLGEESSDEEFGEEAVSRSSSGAEDFEVLEKVKTTSQNGNGKAMKRGKKSARGR